MTDKIMIDGVDVSGCELFDGSHKCICDKTGLDEYKKLRQLNTVKYVNCRDNYNCYYKQLKRKEEECEKLKEKLKPKLKNAHCAYFEGQTGLCRAKEFKKCNPVNCKLYTVDELSTILDLQEQLKRKEQECEISQHYNDELTKYIVSIGELFNLPQKPTTLGKNCIEYYAILSSTIGNQIRDLQSELQAERQKVKELEEKSEKLKIKLMQNDEVNTFFNTPIEGWSNDPCGICRYKQALEEIKEMLEVNIKQIKIYPLKINLRKILQKCEVLDE